MIFFRFRVFKIYDGNNKQWAFSQDLPNYNPNDRSQDFIYGTISLKQLDDLIYVVSSYIYFK